MSHPNTASDIQDAGQGEEPTGGVKEVAHDYTRSALPLGPVAGLGAVPSDPGRTDGRKKNV